MQDNASLNRPEYMVTLGLLPPYSLDDVKNAYRKKAQVMHPDRGGSVDAFRHLGESYELAQEYVQFHSDKRVWIASRVDAYLERDALRQELEQLGAQVFDSRIDWLRSSFGDFAELATSIEAIEVRGKPVGAAVVDRIVDGHACLSGLRRLVLVDCGLDDKAALRLDCLQVLAELDLSGNRLTARMVQLAARMRALRVLQLDGTQVGWFGRWRLARMLRKRSLVPSSPLRADL